MSLGGEYRLWYLEDLIELLQSAGVSAKAKLLEKAARMVVEIDNLFDKDEDKYWKSVDR